jgi:formamidopyrimidine-DNA glycosylase
VPELPDVTIYCEALAARTVGSAPESVRIVSPFVLRSVDPPVEALLDRKVLGVERIGKRVVVVFEGDLFLVIHLMISGRLSWGEGRPKSMKPGGRDTLAVVVFERGHLVLTEASSKKRASIHVVRGRDALRHHDPGGVEPLTATLDEFAHALTAHNRTLKRALTSPYSFSGIGNAYSDEILHTARLSPVRLTQQLKPDEIERLYHAAQKTLTEWTDKLRAEFKGAFPSRAQVTAYRPDFAAHGKYGKPCPVCGMPIQRIQFAENETNYCAKCQNEGRMLADRSLSRLLKSDWPKTIEEMVGE